MSELAAGRYAGWEAGKEDMLIPGPHKVRLVLDPDNRIAESDETNNVWEQTFTGEPQNTPPPAKLFIPVERR